MPRVYSFTVFLFLFFYCYCPAQVFKCSAVDDTNNKRDRNETKWSLDNNKNKRQLTAIDCKWKEIHHQTLETFSKLTSCPVPTRNLKPGLLRRRLHTLINAMCTGDLCRLVPCILQPRRLLLTKPKDVPRISRACLRRKADTAWLAGWRSLLRLSGRWIASCNGFN